MKNTVLIAGVNLVVLFAYSLLIHLNARPEGMSTGVIIQLAYAIAIHVFLCLVIAFLMPPERDDLNKAWLLSAGVVLVVGFSTCMGSANL